VTQEQILKEHDENMNRIITKYSLQLDNYYEELRQESIIRFKLVVLGVLIVSNIILALSI